MRKLYFLIIILCTGFNLYSKEIINGIVKDDKGTPIYDVRISIQGNDYVTSDKSGKFSFQTGKKLEMPLEANVVKKGYELKEVLYFEEENHIEIIIQALKNPDAGKINSIQLVSSDNTLIKNANVVIDGTGYFASETGFIKLNNWANYNSNITLSCCDIASRFYEKKNQSLIIKIGKKIADKVTPTVSPNDIASYETDFNRLFSEFENEKKAIEESSLKVQAEINDLTEKLKNDYTLTPKQREQLKTYITQLENVVEINQSTMKNIHDQEENLIFKLKMIIHQRDSISFAAQKSLEELKKKREEEQHAYSSRLQISIGLILLLTGLLAFSYFINNKMRQQKKTIEEQNKNLDAFVYKASHDIKGPIQSMIGLTNIALRDSKETETRVFFEHLSKSSNKLLKTVNDLLYFTKVKEFNREVHSVPVRKMTDDIISSLSYREGFDKLKINVNIDHDLIIKSDERILYSVFQNFIENAIKYQDSSKPDSYLMINYKNEKDSTSFEFIDNGLGIDKKHHDKLFNMFYKVKDSVNSTGLGLHIVKLSIDKLKGKILVKSAPGVGSTFTISFPKD